MSESPSEKRPLVLVVDDVEEGREICAEYLSFRGYGVAAAEDGFDAIEKATALRPDVILMDLSLPGMDGWEATRRIKEDARTRHIPIIALSAHAMTGDREQALAAGCDDFDTKPIDFARLRGKIEALGSRRDG